MSPAPLLQPGKVDGHLHSRRQTLEVDQVCRHLGPRDERVVFDHGGQEASVGPAALPTQPGRHAVRGCGLLEARTGEDHEGPHPQRQRLVAGGVGDHIVDAGPLASGASNAGSKSEVGHRSQSPGPAGRTKCVPKGSLPVTPPTRKQTAPSFRVGSYGKGLTPIFRRAAMRGAA